MNWSRAVMCIACESPQFKLPSVLVWRCRSSPYSSPSSSSLQHHKTAVTIIKNHCLLPMYLSFDSARLDLFVGWSVRREKLCVWGYHELRENMCERERKSVHRRFLRPSDNETHICSLILRSNRSRWPRCLKAWVCGRLIAGIRFRIPLRAWVFLCVLMIAASVSAWSLVQKNPTMCVCVCACAWFRSFEK